MFRRNEDTDLWYIGHICLKFVIVNFYPLINCVCENRKFNMFAIPLVLFCRILTGLQVPTLVVSLAEQKNPNWGIKVFNEISILFFVPLVHTIINETEYFEQLLFREYAVGYCLLMLSISIIAAWSVCDRLKGPCYSMAQCCLWAILHITLVYASTLREHA